jgi:hypothetical protein
VEGKAWREQETKRRRSRRRVWISKTPTSHMLLYYFLPSLSLSLSLSLILCHVIALEKIIAEGICAKTEFDKR